MINRVGTTSYSSEVKSDFSNSKIQSNKKSVDPTSFNDIVSTKKTINVKVLNYNDYGEIKKLEQELGKKIFLEKGKQLHIYESENFEKDFGFPVRANKIISQIDVGGNRSYVAYGNDLTRSSLVLTNDSEEPVDLSTLKNVVVKGIGMMQEASKYFAETEGKDSGSNFMGLNYDSAKKSADFAMFADSLVNLVEFTHTKNTDDLIAKERYNLNNSLGELEQIFDEMLDVIY